MNTIGQANGPEQEKFVVPPEILTAVQRGFEVFPLQRGTKDGYLWTTYKDGGAGHSWQQQATSGINQVMAWERPTPDATGELELDKPQVSSA